MIIPLVVKNVKDGVNVVYEATSEEFIENIIETINSIGTINGFTEDRANIIRKNIKSGKVFIRISSPSTTTNRPFEFGHSQLGQTYSKGSYYSFCTHIKEENCYTKNGKYFLNNGKTVEVKDGNVLNEDGTINVIATTVFNGIDSNMIAYAISKKCGD